jgi:[acyl-carrier-protein] S-malonyltransferase
MIAMVFPGQGAQHPGMGRRILQEHPPARELARAASDRLGFDLTRLCLDGPEETLQRTEYAQPAILLVSLTLLAALVERGGPPAAVAGHSLGEYAALVAAGGLEPLEALALVHERGQAMAAAPLGTMAAVLGLPDAEVAAACADAGGIVVAANYNAPGQVVISGECDAVERAADLLRARGARRVVALRVGGAFHSPLMAPAASRFAAALDQAPLRPLGLPMAFNVDGAVHQEVASVRRLMLEQVTAPVRWTQCVRTLKDRGAQTFVEVGPQKTLTALIRKTVDAAAVVNVEDLESLAEGTGRLV